MNDRLYLIDVDGIEEEVRCAICENQIKTYKGCDGNCKYDESLFKKITTMIDRRIELLPFNQPEIVRCKDCKYCVYSPATPNEKRPCDPPQPERWHCYKNRDFRPLIMPTDFCSRGKRKEVTT